MRSKKGKRTRRKLRATPILGWLLTVNVVAGPLFSSATAVHRVRVVGEKPYDGKRIEQALQQLRDVPYVRVKQPSVEGPLERLPAVESVNLRRNIFGRAVLTMVYREPVGKVDVRQNVAITEDGLAFATRDDLSTLPLIRLPNTVLRPWLAVGNAYEGKRVGWLCRRVASLGGMDLKVVVVNSQGAVSLWDGSGAKVLFGPAERLEEKVSALESILERRPGFLKNVLELNLLAPNRPRMVERNPVVLP